MDEKVMLFALSNNASRVLHWCLGSVHLCRQCSRPRKRVANMANQRDPMRELTIKLVKYRKKAGGGRASLLVHAALLLAIAGSAGCSVVMEATRPTPVNLSQFDPGEARDEVVSVIGAPTGSTNASDGASCDSYQLYTRGYGAAGKVGIAVLEGAADAFTLGLAETITSPVEGVTQNERHPVLFCYKDSKLVRLTDSGLLVGAFRSAPVATMASASSPPVTASTGQPVVGGAVDPARMATGATPASSQTPRVEEKDGSSPTE
jgi:hypothetical protein